MTQDKVDIRCIRDGADEIRIVDAPRDVVDRGGTRPNRGLGHLCLSGIDRDAGAEPGDERFDQRNDPSELDLHRDVLGSRPSRLTPHVEHVRSTAHQLSSCRDRSLDVHALPLADEAPPIRK